MKGGKRVGAGRKPGAPNKASIARQKQIEESGLTPLAYMLAVMRDEKNDKLVRLDAANKAAPFVHPRLSAVEMSGGLAISHEDALAKLA